jgi:hypothetical protein
LFGENGVCAECSEGVEAKRGCQQLVDVSSFERATRAGLKALLRGVREVFDCHDKPFINATPISGQTHTFKSPTTRLKERFSLTNG